MRERAAAADSEVLLHWPWEVVVMESDGSVCPPTQKRILPPRRPPAAAEVVPLEDAFTVRSRTPWRSVGAIELRWSSALPAGAVIGVEGGPNPVTLTRGLAADQALRLEPSHAGRSPLDAGDVVIDFVTRGSVPAPSRVSVTRGLPEIVWVTEQRSEVPHGAPLPTLTWRLPFETPDGWRLCVRANGAEFSTRIPALDLRLPDDAVDGDGDVHTSGFLASYADVWASTLEHVRAARPDVAAFWLEVTVEAIRGSPSWPLARSRPLFLRVRLRP